MHESNTNISRYCPVGYIDSRNLNNGRWRQDTQGDTNMFPVSRLGSNMYTKDAKTTRDNFRNDFCSKNGEVPWQWEVVDSVYNNDDIDT